MKVLPPKWFIHIDRRDHRLKLFKRPTFGYQYDFVKAYGIAVGMAGLETPDGIYYVNHRSDHPSWTMPDSDWVAPELRGSTLKFNDPANPIKARWLGLDKGVGIHGTADEASIGKDASHGCIRMTVGDVVELYERAKNGTPVYIA